MMGTVAGAAGEVGEARGGPRATDPGWPRPDPAPEMVDGELAAEGGRRDGGVARQRRCSGGELGAAGAGPAKARGGGGASGGGEEFG